jgi:hypothetical protein
MARAIPFFRVGSRPPAYSGYWTTSTGPYMSDLIWVRAGQPYITDTFPADTVPTVCEGEHLAGVARWAVPAVYERTGVDSPIWNGLSRGCSSRLSIGLNCVDMFAFTYEKCDGRRSPVLCIRYNGVSYPLRWRRTSWTEIGIRVIVS